MKPSIYTTWPLYISVVLLIINDHYLKYAFPGFVTGKLSDLAGIFLVVLVLRALFPKNVIAASTSVTIIFIYWKSTASQALIDYLNLYSPLLITRTVDYSDLLALLIIPLAHYVYEARDKYAIKVRLTEVLKIPAIGFAALGIMGTSVMLPHHKYEIRKEVKDQKIDVGKAIDLIKKQVAFHNLECVKCSVTEKEGLFRNNEIELNYRVLENERGIEFDIKGKPGGIFFGNGSWDEMDAIKRRLQNSLGYEFGGMEFVIKLGNR